MCAICDLANAIGNAFSAAALVSFFFNFILCSRYETAEAINVKVHVSSSSLSLVVAVAAVAAARLLEINSMLLLSSSGSPSFLFLFLSLSLGLSLSLFVSFSPYICTKCFHMDFHSSRRKLIYC